MTQDEFLGFIRQLLTGIGGALVTAGYMTQGMMTMAVGVLMAVASAGWMLWSKKRVAKKVEQRVEQALYTPVPGGQ